MVVEPATPSDLPALRDLDAAAFERPWSAPNWRAELTRDDRIWLVARHRDRTVGVGGLWLGVDAAHVLRVAVAVDRRRRGTATRLTDRLIEAAARRGRSTATLEVRASNAPALRLYRRLGFVAHGVRHRYYPDGEDAVVLWREGPREAVVDGGR